MLQGGGALGAYQAGVFEALATMGHTPDWVAGISIGAINAALIAGNPPAQRVERLREFWEGVSSFPFAPPPLPRGAELDGARERSTRPARRSRCCSASRLLHAARAAGAVPAARHAGRDQLLRHRAAAPHARAAGRFRPAQFAARCGFSVGAVNVTTGNFCYFDTHRAAHRRAPHHGQRRAAAGLSADRDRRRVLLGRRHRLQHAAAVRARRAGQGARGSSSRSTCSPRAARCRRRSAEANEREKDIRFSSRTRLNTTYELRRQATLQAARRLVAKLPASLRDDPDAKALAAHARRRARSTVVHLIYRSKHYESQSKDYEFSRASMLEHWAAGMADTQATLEDPRWLGRDRRAEGVHVFDLAVDRAERRQDHHSDHRLQGPRPS